MLCPPLAPPSPFVLVHLIGRLDDLQEATIASLMEMMSVRSGHTSLGTALSQEEGLKRVTCHRHGAQFLTLLGNKVPNQVSPSPFPQFTSPLASGAGGFILFLACLIVLYLRTDPPSHPDL